MHVDASSPDGEQTFGADYVIGADGARSAVRKALDIDLSGDIYPETTILATTRFPFHERLEGLSNVSYCWKPDGTFSLLRLPDVWRASLYAREGQSIEQALTDEGLQDLLHDIVPDADIDVLETQALSHPSAARVDLPQGPRLSRRRCRASQQPVRRHGHERRHSRRLQPRREAHAVLQDGADERILDRYERQRRPIAEEEIIQQSHRNRTRMQERDPAAAPGDARGPAAHDR